MKDLKHLIYFERLLENADNELIEKRKKEGGICLGYTCFHIPEVLLNVDRCFSTRLRAPNTGSIDIATYYMTTTPASSLAPCSSVPSRAGTASWTR